MRTLLTITALILLASLVLNGYFIWDRAQAQKERYSENSRNQEAISKHLATAKTAARRADSLQIAFVQRRTSDSVALRAVKIENSAKSKKVDDLRVPVQPLIDSIAELRAFVTAYDSLLAGKNKEIREMETRHIGQILDLQAIVKERTDEVMAQIAISKVWEITAVDAQQDAAKQKRGKTFWKVTSGVLGGVVLWMAIKE